MSDTRSRKNREGPRVESISQNMENNDSIPSDTRVPEDSGEPIHHVSRESHGEVPQREVSSPSSTGRGFVHRLYGKFTEIVK